ncbi:SAM-dependent methyltransferase [Aurantimonas endophytica]|uniref:Cyclopropane-fatty-acyl-phospholipid synthase n=1 Tax=Aurantimonas endophytica TaxID=1522175 RepID=A0A7W6H9B0_9HYPH|nr:cyclopropane-fatty-acyl-phospholipid synthase family protein [Aurantimonas endophytica]MBB4001014.1 cyclopropane-fatty-acyl-phospholipid synthase [Aurantimonas endophytica]MCO6403330.1 methyltransferase domain-containing protein [Aurantimonas endophytica]
MNRILSVFLSHLFKTGNLTITDASGGVTQWGDGTGEKLHIRFNTKAAERAVALHPSLKFGEAYMDGGLDVVSGSIYDVLALIFANADRGDAAREPWMRAIARMRLLYRRYIQNNTPRRARANVQHHYDLSGALYDLFLDADRQYSCAYFERPGASLEEAQLAKKRHIAAKLNFDRPGLRALDIGCGWGGMGLYLAGQLQAEVTGITLSDEQLAVARKRAEDAGLADRAKFRIEDYRDVKGQFDRIVSVGMFEHVGVDFYEAYFSRCAELLEADGVMLLHTIGRFEEPTNTNSFIAKYIFPGGYIPSLSQMTAAIERAGLIVTDVEVLRLHYAETLRHWRERFAARRDEAKALYDERFCRMWEFYLAASEGSFRWQDLVVFQVQLTKSRDALPLTRDYMFEAEARLRQRDDPDAAAASREGTWPERCAAE